MASKRNRSRKSSGRPLKAAALVAGGLLGIFVASQAFASTPARDEFAEQSTAPAGGPPKPKKKAVAKKAPAAAAPAPAGEVLKQGETSEKVRTMQQAIIELGGEPARILQDAGGADGNYGPATAAALKASGVPQPAAVSSTAYKAIVTKATAKVQQANAQVKGGMMAFLNPKPAAPTAKKPAAKGLLNFLNPAPAKKIVLKAPAKKPTLMEFLNPQQPARPAAKPVAKLVAPKSLVKPVAKKLVAKKPVIKKAAPRPVVRAAVPKLAPRPVAVRSPAGKLVVVQGKLPKYVPPKRQIAQKQVALKMPAGS